MEMKVRRGWRGGFWGGLLAACCVLGAPAAAVAEGGEGATKTDEQWAQEFGFPVGEELVYALYWGGIPIGSTRVTTGWVEEGGQRLLRIREVTLSNKVIGTIYPVNDLVETFVDPETFLPVCFVRNISEGRTRHRDETVFDFEAMKARSRSFTKAAVREFEIEKDTRDILCFMYYTRRQGFQAETAPEFKVMADDKLCSLTTHAQKVEKVHLDRYGDVECLKMEPKAEFDGLFVRKGRMFTWVSNDPRHVLVKAWIDTPFANVKVLLEDVLGPGSDFWVKPE